MTDKWIRDTAYVVALICILLGFKISPSFYWVAALVLLALLFFPKLLWPIARVWLALTETLGMVMNKVFFGLVFFVVVTPIALLRRMFAGESHKKDSAFFDKSGAVRKEDLTKPY